MKSLGFSRLQSFLVLAGLVAVLLTPLQMSRTSDLDYCLSCHEMKRHAEELKRSSHAVDKDKKPIECAQCHIPHQIGPRYVTTKVILGMKDLTVHYLTDTSKLSRRKMQDWARRFVPDENCMVCHADLFRNAKNTDKVSDVGKLCHEAYLGINGTTKRNCAGCHFNMAHLPEFDQRYKFNTEFVKRLLIDKKEERL